MASGPSVLQVLPIIKESLIDTISKRNLVPYRDTSNKIMVPKTSLRHDYQSSCNKSGWAECKIRKSMEVQVLINTIKVLNPAFASCQMNRETQKICFQNITRNSKLFVFQCLDFVVNAR